MVTRTSLEKLKIYGSNLRRIRESQNITLEQLSVKTKIRLQYLSKIEKGEAYGLSIKQVFVISEVLKTYPHLFFEDK